MGEYLSPGVYIEEVNSGPRPIEGVGTAMAAFVGFAPGGEVNKPTLITNWTQYVEAFGVEDPPGSGRLNPHLQYKDPRGNGKMRHAYLSHSVYGYFLNGGGRCWVTSLGPGRREPGRPAGAGPAPLEIPGKSGGAAPVLRLKARDKDAGGIEVEVRSASGDAPPPGAFTLWVRKGGTEELFENVTLKSGPTSVVEAVNAGAHASRLVAVVDAQPSGAPRPGSYTLSGTALVSASAGLPQVQSNHFIGQEGTRDGIAGLEISEDATMLCCPDLMSALDAGLLDLSGVKQVQSAMISHCELLKDRIAILDAPPGLTPAQIKNWRRVETNFDSTFAALYYPWIEVTGPDGKTLTVPPCGHMAGIYARSDQERGVHKAPANEIVRGALQSAYMVTKGEQDVLNPEGINCIRSFSGRGIRVWGARTLSSDPAWRYVNVRRLFSYVEKSIERHTQWVVFEPNDPDLWARVRRDVGAFLTRVWRDGALFGLTSSQAFFVKCDEELNPEPVRDAGQLIIEIGLAPVKPAEFVIFRLRQLSGGGA